MIVCTPSLALWLKRLYGFRPICSVTFFDFSCRYSRLQGNGVVGGKPLLCNYVLPSPLLTPDLMPATEQGNLFNNL